MLSSLTRAERVVVAFIVYGLVRVVAFDHPRFDTHAFPPVELIVVFGLVLAVRLFLDYRRIPWPESAAAARRQHLVALGFFAILVPLGIVTAALTRPSRGFGAGAAWEVLFAIHAWVFFILVFSVPVALYWLASARYIKENGRLNTLGMVQTGWRRALAATRDWLPILACLYAYGLMGPIIGQGVFPDLDGALGRLDRTLFFGHDPRILLEPLISRPLSAWLSACYVLYVSLFPLVLGVVFAKNDPVAFRELSYAVTLTFAIGYVFYSLVPAQGPLFVDHFDVPLDGYYGEWIKHEFMDRTRVPRDCFPSLHTAVSFTLLWGAYRHVRWLFWALAPIVLSIPLACVYFRYHYVVDVLAGFLLVGLVIAEAARVRRLHRTLPKGAVLAPAAAP